MDIGWNIGVEFWKNHWGGNTTEIENTYTKWVDEGRFFLLPNAIFTLGLRPGEMTVYAYLIFCEDRKSHQCWPSIGHISQHTDMSANTVAKYIRQLEEERLIDTEPTKVKTKAMNMERKSGKCSPARRKRKPSRRLPNISLSSTRKCAARTNLKRPLKRAWPAGCKFSSFLQWSGQHMTGWNAQQTTRSIR